MTLFTVGLKYVSHYCFFTIFGNLQNLEEPMFGIEICIEILFLLFMSSFLPKNGNGTQTLRNSKIFSFHWRFPCLNSIVTGNGNKFETSNGVSIAIDIEFCQFCELFETFDSFLIVFRKENV